MEGNHLEEELVMAKQIAKAAHKNQIDKAGVDYFEHVKTVGDAGETIEEKIVGYLHDVVEDSHITITDLSEHGFSDSILSAVDAITRRKSESWRKYIQRAGDNSIAAKVKINDLKHNSDLSRIASPGEVDLSRQRKYQAAIANLLEKQLFH